MTWINGTKHKGFVCATHDRQLGRLNLIRAGMSLRDVVLFERYLRYTAEMSTYPDWPEWREQHQTRKDEYALEQFLEERKEDSKLLNGTSPLTPREREAANLMRQGLNNLEVAEKLGLAENTVKALFRSAYKKLGARNRVEAVNKLKGLDEPSSV
jgi:DNA-binding CsgD family transcriptional regulator